MKKPEQIKRIRAKMKKMMPDMDMELVDFEALVDSALTYKENLSNILRGYAVKPTQKESKRAFETAIAQLNGEQMLLLHEAEQTAQAGLEDALSKQTPVLNEAFGEAKQMLDAMVSSPSVHGMVFVGPAGLGKTTCVQQELTKLDKKIGEDFIVVTGYITPLALYTLMYNNSTKIIVFDDIMMLLDNEMNRGFLQAGLWNPTGVRKIDYGSMSGKLQVPSSFAFNGKVVWSCNSVPSNFEALKSRVFYYELDFTYAEKVKLMFEVAQVNGIPKEIPDFIYNETKLAGEAYRIDFRLLFKLNALKDVNADWKVTGKKLLELNADVYAAITALRDSTSVKQACAIFCEQSGRSRATFFRIRKRLEKSQSIKER